VIQLGEHPDTVFNVGALGLENNRRLKLLERPELERSLDFQLGSPFFLVTYHPETLGTPAPQVALAKLFQALDQFPGARVVITKPNPDTGGRELGQLMDAYAQRNPGRVAVFTSLGQLRYLSALRLADAVIGNSSSGIIEAPAFPTPTVNIGVRQSGGLKAASIIDCGEQAGEVIAAINQALSPAFRSGLGRGSSLFGSGETAVQIRDVLKRAALGGVKRFYDLKVDL
jgi:UDP-hydrolysing UDP-N-acetyl-D-glucosamine 2-epimerase